MHSLSLNSSENTSTTVSNLFDHVEDTDMSASMNAIRENIGPRQAATLIVAALMMVVGALGLLGVLPW